MRRSRHAAPTPRRTKVDVTPERLALSAASRIRDAGYRLGGSRHVDEGSDGRELAARAAVLGRELPGSYAAVLRYVQNLGKPDELLDAAAMATRGAELRRSPGGSRYLPFASSEGRLLCFDSRGEAFRGAGELAVVAFAKGYATPVARGFAEWLDTVADQREARLAAAAMVPPKLATLLAELGFVRSGLVAEVETADGDAIETLVGEPVVDALLETGSLYDSTGKALLQLAVDDYSMRVRLREGFVDVAAEDVFPWLRSFRDDDFFEGVPLSKRRVLPLSDLDDAPTETRAPDRVRDLRRSPRQKPARASGIVELATLGAERHTFLDATGGEDDVVYLLGRRDGTRRSLVARVEGTTVVSARYVDEPLARVHLAPDGSLWALGASSVVRFRGFELDRFALTRPGVGQANWLGLGSLGQRPLVWGAGALLRFDGNGFAPFRPDLSLHSLETVHSVQTAGDSLAALVVRAGFGAVAHFDGDRWLPIDEAGLVEGAPNDLRCFAGQDWVLEGNTAVYTQLKGGEPHEVSFPRSSPAFLDASRRARPLFQLLPDRTGLLFASLGGFLFAPTRGDATFHRGRSPELRGRIVQLDHVRPPRPHNPFEPNEPGSPLVLALLGGSVWVRAEGAFHPLDLTHF